MSKEEAREIIAIALAGGGPTAEQASYAFDAEYEEALSVLYPMPDDENETGD
jgi:hypothetical protein